MVPTPPEDVTVWQAIAASWLSMKTWVKVWLFALNGIFLAAVAFWSEPAAKATLVGYAASAPLLLVLMLRQRGLTRLLGLAHLIPWVPLLAYLVGRLTSNAVGPRISFGDVPALFSYLVVLVAAIAVCLAFDVLDVVRWVRGERYVLGSAEAVQVKASYPAPSLPCQRAA
jgi:hypothetical protein